MHLLNKTAVTLGLVTALAFGAGASAPVAQAAAGEATGTRWSETILPVDDSRGSAVVRPDAYTTWIAGSRLRHEGKLLTFAPSLVERDVRKGGGWREVALPALPAGTDVQIYGADASTSRSGVLVGDYDDAVGGFLTERRTGSSWSVAAAPAPAKIMVGSLLGVDEVAPNDAWAVGFAQIDDGSVPDPDGGLPHQLDHFEPIARHWDGSAWQVIPVPAFESGAYLFSVTAVSARDVWAVGRTGDLQPIAIHFDGTSWTNVPLPGVRASFGTWSRVARTRCGPSAASAMRTTPGPRRSPFAWTATVRARCRCPSAPVSWTRAPSLGTACSASAATRRRSTPSP
ncbi:hypothetical protein ACU686_03565 [Yinghuangia aomiensis]